MSAERDRYNAACRGADYATVVAAWWAMPRRTRLLICLRDQSLKAVMRGTWLPPRRKAAT